MNRAERRAKRFGAEREARASTIPRGTRGSGFTDEATDPDKIVKNNRLIRDSRPGDGGEMHGRMFSGGRDNPSTCGPESVRVVPIPTLSRMK